MERQTQNCMLGDQIEANKEMVRVVVMAYVTIVTHLQIQIKYDFPLNLALMWGWGLLICMAVVTREELYGLYPTKDVQVFAAAYGAYALMPIIVMLRVARAPLFGKTKQNQSDLLCKYGAYWYMAVSNFIIMVHAYFMQDGESSIQGTDLRITELKYYCVVR